MSYSILTDVTAYTPLTGARYLIRGDNVVTNGTLFYAEADGVDFLVDGSITASFTWGTGISGYLGDTNVMEGGSVFGTHRALYILYYGSIAKITNSGFISSAPWQDRHDEATIFTYAPIRLTNTGTIENLLRDSNLDAKEAILIDQNSDESIYAQMFNYGEILGDIRLGVGFDYVENRGFIDGDVYMGGGNDTYYMVGGRVAGSVFGGDGDDYYFVDRSNAEISESATTAGGRDTVYSTASFKLGNAFERLFLYGTDDINGRGNTLDNEMAGNVGDNILKGHQGDDTFYLSGGFDIYRGGKGSDTVSFQGQTGHLVIDLASGTWTSTNSEEDGAIFISIENIIGDNGDDDIRGDNGANRLSGGTGDDTIRGGKGDDVLDGGWDRDILIGQKGADLFLFSEFGHSRATAETADVIRDFKPGQDQIDLSVLALTSFIGKDAFGNVAGELRYVRKTGLLEADVDGDGITDFAIVLENNAKLTLTDLIL